MKTENMKWTVAGLVCLLVSGCSVPMASLYVKSSSCRQNLSMAAATVVLRDRGDFDVTKAALKAKTEAEHMQLLREVMVSSLTSEDIAAKIASKIPLGREFKSFYFSFADTRYDFLVQNGEANACWLRLFKKASEGFVYTNTMTFIDSEQVTGCTCSDNQVQIGL